LPIAGQREIVVDSEAQPVTVIETVAVGSDATAQRNKRLVVRLIDEVWNGGDTGLLAELWDGPSREEAYALHQTLTGAFPDLRTDIEDLIAERDRVVARLSLRGTHQGEFRGIAPTGRAVHFTAIRVYRIADGKIVESWANQDALGLLNQLRGSGG
jgi:ketosteroid isomerase-like protein